jgi:hypothetical protein
MSAVKEHLEQVNDPTVSSEELTYDKQSARAKTVGADEVLALFPALPVKVVAPAAAAAAQPEPVDQLPGWMQFAPAQQMHQDVRRASPARRQSPMQQRQAPVDVPRPRSAPRGRVPPFDPSIEESDDELEARAELLQEKFYELMERAAKKGIALEDIPSRGDELLSQADIDELNALDPNWDEIWMEDIQAEMDYEDEQEYYKTRVGGLRGLGDASDTEARARKRRARVEQLENKRLSSEAEKAAAYLWTSHSELLRTAWVRDGAAAALVGRTITPMRVADLPFDLPDRDPDEVVLLLDKPIDSPQAFAAMSGAIRYARLLSWTTKMDCPSYSLPAGPTGAGFNGSCPGALAGQTITADVDAKRNQTAAVYQIHQKNRGAVDAKSGKKLDDEKWAQLANVNAADCVCQSCYAEKNKYSYTSNQMGALIRQAWTEAAVLDGSFVTVMDFAIKTADYYLEGGTRENKDLSAEPGLDINTGEPAKFFRIHDSGDWFSEKYYLAWCEVARRNPNVTFWAPTRVWVLNVDWVNDTPPPDNLVVRPSAYMFNRPATLLRSLVRGPGRGYSAPSVSYAVDKDKPLPNYIASGYPYHWQCQAYAGAEKHSCRGAMSPPTDQNPEGTLGCRACWVFPLMAINYKKH